MDEEKKESRSILSEKYHQAASIISRQGIIPLPVSETTVSILKLVIEDNEEELDLIFAFSRKGSQTLAELKESGGLRVERIDAVAASLAAKGLLFNQPSSSGVMVFRLLPLMNVGLLEYRFMSPLKGDPKELELAHLFENLMSETRSQIQSNYDALGPVFANAPPVDRTVPTRTNQEGKPIRIVPVQRTVAASPAEVIVPTQKVEEIIEKFEEIAVGYCFCRQRRATLGEPCSIEAPLRNCFTFGKSARHTVSQGFAEPVTKEEALRIMKEAEAAGLVHKAFHPGSNIDRPETSICNCCKECCDTFRLWREGTLPLINATNFLAVMDKEICSGCGTCVERCPMDAITLDDDGKAARDEARCLGCGVCARFCPEGAISLQEGFRRVFIPPPRKA
jgi:ferredoxin